ncbi:MAG: C25 family peptidase propeptide domain-containing protein, partial [Candidatus Edwardsbacteria bacterium]|nr:C25 family peptidase propeptide domain-containing protein [Candidatus Edwardsbacteria bacterium]
MIIRSDDRGLLLECTFDSPVDAVITVNGTVYHRYTVPGCINSIVAGAPALPQRGILFAVPPDCNARLIAVSAEDPLAFAGLPAPAPAIDGDSLTYRADPRLYQSRQRFPAALAEISGPAWAGDRKVAAVVLHPLQYDPEAKEVIAVKRIRLEIAFVPAAQKDAVPASRPGRKPNRHSEQVLSSVINAAAAKDWRCLPAALAAAKEKAASDTLPAKILINRDGWYAVGYNDLANGGINPSSIDPRTIKLFNRGEEAPVYFTGQGDGVFDPGDRFEFYGERARGDQTHFHPFTDANVYWLAWGGLPGGRMIEEDGAPAAPGAEIARRYAHTLHLEKDSLFVRLKRRESDQRDRWFWKRIDQNDSYAVALPLSDLDLSSGRPLRCRFKLDGYTVFGTDPRTGEVTCTGIHHAMLTLNGRSIVDTTWNEQRPCLIEVDVPSSFFTAGDNQVTFLQRILVNDIDSYLLDWIEVEYPRVYQAPEGYMEFTRPDTSLDRLYRFTVSGMPSQNIEIYKPGVSKITGGRIDVGPSGLDYSITFTDRTIGPARYIAVIDDSMHKLKPQAIVANRTS